MKLVDSKSVSKEIFEKAWRVVESSFPLAEQRSLGQHMRAMDDPEFRADIIFDDEQFVGILFYWIYDSRYLFIEHLAIDPELRGSGYGKRAMELILDKGYVTLLEIDPPEDSVSVRRLDFYQRLGFVANPYEHIHPSYRPETEAHRLIVMSYPCTVTQEEFDRFREYTLGRILEYTDR